jgi:hypothetical protein
MAIGGMVTPTTMGDSVNAGKSAATTPALASGNVQPASTYSNIYEANAAAAQANPTVKMAVGGMAMPTAPAPQREQAAPPMQSPASAQTPAALGQAPEATAGEPSTRDIVTESMKADNFTPQEKTAVSTFLTSPVAKEMVTLRNNNTLFMVMGAEPGVVTAQTFSIDPPEMLQDSVSKFIASLTEANIKELRGETKNPMLLQSYEDNGLVPESTEENGIISYRVALPQKAEAATAPAPETAPPPEMPPVAAAPPAQSPTPMV